MLQPATPPPMTTARALAGISVDTIQWYHPPVHLLNGLNEYLIPGRVGIDDRDRNGPHFAHHDADHVGTGR